MLLLFTDDICLDPSQAYLVFLCLALLCFADIAYLQTEVFGNPALSKSTGAIFQTAFAHFESLCHILVIFTIFATFSLLYLLW